MRTHPSFLVSPSVASSECILAVTHAGLALDLIIGGIARHSLGAWVPLLALAPLWLWVALHLALAVALAVGVARWPSCALWACRGSLAGFSALGAAFMFSALAVGTSFVGVVFCMGYVLFAFSTHLQARRLAELANLAAGV